MPVAAKCPSCSAPLSETSVLALAPVCLHCGCVITEVGGTLGLTGVYGVNHPSITRQRVAADLSVFQHHLNNSRGMLESCKEQLTWGVERYAKLPPDPELLQLKDAPSLGQTLGQMFGGAGILIGSLVGLFVVSAVFGIVFNIVGPIFLEKQSVGGVNNFMERLFQFVFFGGAALVVAVPLVIRFNASLANGQRPQENARRQRAYQEAVAAALKAAEPVKAAAGHRLRIQIRELESLIKTLGKREADVRGILATL